MEGQSEIDRFGELFEGSFMGRLRDEGSGGSDNQFDGASGDDDQDDAVDEEAEVLTRKRKKYHRHSPYQIQELEAFFKECPHPDEKQRLELSRRLGLESKQIKFWFQNRRTQMKTQMERHENIMLRDDNNRLRNENDAMRSKLADPICSNCGGTAVFNGTGMVSYGENLLRVENARLKDEVARVRALTDKFLGKQLPTAFLPSSPPRSNRGSEFSPQRHVPNVSIAASAAVPMGMSSLDGMSNASPATPYARTAAAMARNQLSAEKSAYIDVAIASMNELIKMAEPNSRLWLRTLDGAKEVLNHEEFSQLFTPRAGVRRGDLMTEASRETGIVPINSLAVVEILMDVNRWAETFPCIIARSSTIEVISSGIRGNRNGALQVMHAEFQVLTPLVPLRQVRFLRFCKQHGEGMWAVVDVSIGMIEDGSDPRGFANCRRLPSGCVLQDMPNGCSKVTWIEHSEYDETAVHPLYHSFLSSGMGFSAQRWMASLQRHCECLLTFISSTSSNEDSSGMNASGRRNMLKLAQRMTDNFCSGICASPLHDWEILHLGNMSGDVRVTTRKNAGRPGEPPGIVLSAATSIWMPIAHGTVFNFVRNEQLRSEWDILSHGGPMQEIVHVAKGQRRDKCVSLLRANALSATDTSMVILQETWTDASGSLIAYAPVDITLIESVISGGDPNSVALLPSGFALLPDSPSHIDGLKNPDGSLIGTADSSGCLMTIGFQILVSSTPAAKLTAESVETVHNLLSRTIQRIKTALRLP
ncbi:homeobox-leucine zipper protein HDG1 isoform X2 [Rhodamnia argentea]|nr:homeobox-leucine zipper protein HDG1 isoform X2 [Rhodamnia argentea]